MRENGWDELLEEVNNFCSKNDICVPNMEDNVPGRIRSRRGGQSVPHFHHFHVEIFCQVLSFLSFRIFNTQPFSFSVNQIFSCNTRLLISLLKKWRIVSLSQIRSCLCA